MVFHLNTVVKIFLVVTDMAQYIVLELVVVFNDGEVKERHFLAGYAFAIGFDERGVCMCGFEALGECSADDFRKGACQIICG